MCPTDIHPEDDCSFCGAAKKNTRLLISSTIRAGVFICDSCVPTCVRMTVDHLSGRVKADGSVNG